MTEQTNPPARAVWVPLLFDVVAVLIFAAIGRSSHEEGLSVIGIGSTAWPFLSGLMFGWALVYLLALIRSSAPFVIGFTPGRLFPPGVIIWIGTLIAAMMLRQLSSQGTAFSFIVVATIVLGAFLLGWRAIVLLIARRPYTPR